MFKGGFMSHKTWLVSAFVGLSLAFTACPTTPAPVLSSVTVTAPSSNALKINEAVQFSAVAKDSGSSEIAGKVFTWLSSDPNVASVDSNGMVTAKRFGTVKIMASVEGKSGESASQITFGLEVIGGMASNGAGTAFLIRFRNSDDTGAKANMNMTVTGPATWNSGKPYTRNGFYIDKWSWFQTNWFGPAVIPVSGNYMASATVNSQTYTSIFALDTAQSLPDITGLAISSASTSSVTGSWDAVANAKSYMVEIWNDTDGRTDSPSKFVTSTNAMISGLSLDPAKTYYFQVHALSTDVTAPLTTPINTQHNVKFNRIKLGAFANPAVTGTVNGYSLKF
jgi:hypothetical protein